MKFRHHGDQPNNVNLATLVVYVVRVERGFAGVDEGVGSRVFIVLERGSGCGPLLLSFWREVVDSRSRCRGRGAVSLKEKEGATECGLSPHQPTRPPLPPPFRSFRGSLYGVCPVYLS